MKVALSRRCFQKVIFISTRLYGVRILRVNEVQTSKREF